MDSSFDGNICFENSSRSTQPTKLLNYEVFHDISEHVVFPW